MEKRGKRGSWCERVEGHSSFKILYASLRPVFVFRIFFLERFVFVRFVCLSAAYTLVLICVIEWLVLISISFFFPTGLIPFFHC